MRKARLIVAGLAVATLPLALAACGSTDENSGAVAADCEPKWDFDTVTEGYLTVAAVNNPPAILVNADTGEAEGFDAEILPGFAEAACLELRWTPLAGAPAVAAMTEGRVDLGSGGWAITPERGEVIGQFEEGVYWNMGAILAKDEINSLEDLQGMTVGVEGGSQYHEPVVDFMGEENVRIYPSVEAEIGDLNAGRIDAVFSQAIQMAHQASERDMLEENTISILPPDESQPVLTGMNPSNYPFTKSNTALGAAIQEYIATMKETGELAEILESYGLQTENIEGPDAADPATK